MWYRTTADDQSYRHYVNNIAQRFNFRIEEADDGTIFKVRKHIRVVLLESNEAKPTRRWWTVWQKLYDEYEYGG